MVAAARPQCQPGLVLAAPSGWSPCWDLFERNCNTWLRADQICRLSYLAEYLKQHLGRLPEKPHSVAQIGGMALDLTDDLQLITQQHSP
jgi:hypothetical protein